jgi:hypothetical protein
MVLYGSCSEGAAGAIVGYDSGSEEAAVVGTCCVKDFMADPSWAWHLLTSGN